MPQILVSTEVGTYAHLSKLYSFIEAMQTHPGFFNREVKPAAEDWIRGEIETIEKELYGIKIEAATGQGDYFENGFFENNIAFSIPTEGRQFKDSFFYL
ncbi:MAG: hypothetical protein K0Q73_7681 [Paenibacillus sp.]|nr:hypothetical protein [Paenibacillus sp.]